MKILALDTSCDDTSAAVLDGHIVLSNVVSSQIALHQPYGGVFPTVAKLAHQQNVAPVTALALKRAHLSFADLDGIGVTVGPGLAPALEIGISYAKKVATDHHLPLIGVNHLEGHLLSPLIAAHSRQKTALAVPFPHHPTLALIVSGGHTLFVRVQDFGQYQVLGQTLDDAAGECLDKIGRMLGLGYPAGPVLEQLATSGDPTAYRFPLPLTTRHDFDLSFSGLKTFAKNLITSLRPDGQPLTRATICNVAASAQAGVFAHVLYKLKKIYASANSFDFQSPHYILLGGGVAANVTLRRYIRIFAKNHQTKLLTPYTKKLCGDNAAMIAFVAGLKLQHGLTDSPGNLERQPNLSLTSWPTN